MVGKTMVLVASQHIDVDALVLLEISPVAFLSLACNFFFRDVCFQHELVAWGGIRHLGPVCRILSSNLCEYQAENVFIYRS